MASPTTAGCSIPPPIAGCSMPSAAMRISLAEVAGALRRMGSRARGGRSPAPRRRRPPPRMPIICAMRSTELSALAPETGEEERLAGERALLMNASRIAEDISAAIEALSGERGAESGARRGSEAPGPHERGGAQGRRSRGERARTGLRADRGGAPRTRKPAVASRRSMPASSNARKSGCSRCATPRANMPCRSDELRPAACRLRRPSSIPSMAAAPSSKPPRRPKPRPRAGLSRGRAETRPLRARPRPRSSKPPSPANSRR